MKALLLLLLALPVSAMDITYTIIDGERVAEFGDLGKAANQYPTKVGDMNVISSVIITQLNGRTYVTNQPKIDPELTDDTDSDQ